jgi:hypothetical protein
MIFGPRHTQLRKALARHRHRLVASSVVAAALLSGPAASAATYTAHDGGSLATALQQANSQSGPSTIDLSPGVYLPDGTLTVARDITIAGAANRESDIDGTDVLPVGSSLLAVDAGAQLTFVDVTVTTAGTIGGDAAVDVSGVIDVENSTLAGNDGPDLTVEIGASATIRNSTLSDGLSAGLVDDGAAQLINSTVADNAVEGVDDSVGRLDLVNTIVAENGSPDCSAPAASSDHSLDSDGTCGVGALSRVNPDLGRLGANGGPTQTHALEPGSPAIGAGDQARCPPEDQRHYARADGHCDIGAYEAGAAPDASAPSGAPASPGAPSPPKAPAKAPASGSAPHGPTAVSGHGVLRGSGRSAIRFAVHARAAAPHGGLIYHDLAGRVWLKASSLASVRIDAGRGTATIKGAGTELVRRRRVTFTAVLTDHAGVRSLRIRLSDGYDGGGRLVAGSGTMAFTGASLAL